MTNNTLVSLVESVLLNDARMEQAPLTSEIVLAEVQRKIAIWEEKGKENITISICLGTNGQFGTPNITLVDFRNLSEGEKYSFCFDEKLYHNVDINFWKETGKLLLLNGIQTTLSDYNDMDANWNPRKYELI